SRHDQKIRSNPPRQLHHRPNNLQRRMDRVDERRILVDRHLRRHHIIRDSPDRTRQVPPDRSLVIVHDENLGKRKMLLDPLSSFVSITLSGFTLILTAPSRTRNSTTSG